MQASFFSVKKILIGILIILGLINTVTIITILFSQSNLDNEITVASRNNMLAQKMAFYANLYVNGDQSAKPVCESVIDLHDRSINALKNGGMAPGYNGVSLNNASGTRLNKLNESDSIWQDYKRNLLNVLNEPLLQEDGETVNPVVKQSLDYINDHTSDLASANNGVLQAYIKKSDYAQSEIKNELIIAFIVMVLVILSCVIYVNRSVFKPLDHLIEKIKHLAKGNYEEEMDLRGNNEFGTLSKHLNTVFNKFRLSATYIEEIGKGNLAYQLDKNHQEEFENDRFFIALNKTREELNKIEEQNKIRQWTNEGIRIISELLQKRHEDIQTLYDDLISTIVKYVEANQGGLFVKSEKEGKDCLELMGCYAYERKKFLHEAYDIEEGLLGQSFKEGNLVVMTEVPEDYVHITSGLGSSTPKCLVLIPLIDNENKVGVLEIALFENIEEYKVEFLKKIAEMIASALNSIMINEQTKELLSESQQQAEEMKAQEEEMRQNMEELSATQEEMDRVMKEVQDKEAFMNSLINATNDVIFAVDSNYELLTCNDPFKYAYENQGIVIEKGFNILSLFPDKKDRETHKEYYDRALQGEYFEILETFNMEGDEKHFNVIYSPIKDKDGKVIAMAAFTKDITELENNRREVQRLFEDSQQQTEELKAQEEEMRQNMEEMQATQEEMSRKEQEASKLLEEANDNKKQLEAKVKDIEKMKEKLELENAMFSGLMDVLPDRITIKDKKGKYLRVNRAKVDALASQGIKNINGKSDKELYGEEHFQKSFKIEKSIMNSGKPELNKEDKIVMPDGTVKWGATSRAPFKNKNGEILGSLVVTRDITELKQCREDLEKALKKK